MGFIVHVILDAYKQAGQVLNYNRKIKTENVQAIKQI